MAGVALVLATVDTIVAELTVGVVVLLATLVAAVPEVSCAEPIDDVVMLLAALVVASADGTAAAAPQAASIPTPAIPTAPMAMDNSERRLNRSLCFDICSISSQCVYTA